DTDRRPSALAPAPSIIDTVLTASQPLTSTEIDTETHLDQSTTMRLLRSLEENGQILRTYDGKRYMGSPKALMPTPLMHPVNQLRREADALLRELSAKIGETEVLALFINHDRIAIDIAQPPRALGPYYSSWLKGAYRVSGAGKTLLLSLEEPRWKALVGAGPYRAITAYTLTTQERLAQDLRKAREPGYAIAREER